MKTVVAYINNDKIKFILASEKERANVVVYTQWLYFYKLDYTTPSRLDFKQSYNELFEKFGDSSQNVYVGSVFQNISNNATFEDVKGNKIRYSDLLSSVVVPVFQKRIEDNIGTVEKINIILVFATSIRESERNLFRSSLPKDVFHVIDTYDSLSQIAFSLYANSGGYVDDGALFVNTLDDDMDVCFFKDIEDYNQFYNFQFCQKVRRQVVSYILSLVDRNSNEMDINYNINNEVDFHWLDLLSKNKSSRIILDIKKSNGVGGYNPSLSYEDLFDFCKNNSRKLIDSHFLGNPIKMPLIIRLSKGNVQDDFCFDIFRHSMPSVFELTFSDVVNYQFEDLLFSVIKDDKTINELRPNQTAVQQSYSLSEQRRNLRKAERSYHIFLATGQTQEAQNAFKEYEKWSNMLKS